MIVRTMYGSYKQDSTWSGIGKICNKLLMIHN